MGHIHSFCTIDLSCHCSSQVKLYVSVQTQPFGAELSQQRPRPVRWSEEHNNNSPSQWHRFGSSATEAAVTLVWWTDWLTVPVCQQVSPVPVYWSLSLIWTTNSSHWPASRRGRYSHRETFFSTNKQDFCITLSWASLLVYTCHMVSTTKATMTKKREHLGGIQTEGGPLFKNNAEGCVGRDEIWSRKSIFSKIMRGYSKYKYNVYFFQIK